MTNIQQEITAIPSIKPQTFIEERRGSFEDFEDNITPQW